MDPQKQEVLCRMKSLADPTRLKPLNKRDGLLQVIIETPAGSRNKFAFDPDQKISAFPGCAVPARLIGVIEGEQVDGKKRIRNDRLVAVAEANHMYANVKKLGDLPGKWIKELQVFFVNYHNLEGKKYQLLGCKGTDAALKVIKDAKKGK
jgi:inorganic pyrophosphatase